MVVTPPLPLPLPLPPLQKRVLPRLVHPPPSRLFSMQSEFVGILTTFLLILTFSVDFFLARDFPNLPEDLLLAYSQLSSNFDKLWWQPFWYPMERPNSPQEHPQEHPLSRKLAIQTMRRSLSIEQWSTLQIYHASIDVHPRQRTEIQKILEYFS